MEKESYRLYQTSGGPYLTDEKNFIYIGPTGFFPGLNALKPIGELDGREYPNYTPDVIPNNTKVLPFPHGHNLVQSFCSSNIIVVQGMTALDGEQYNRVRSFYEAAIEGFHRAIALGHDEIDAEIGRLELNRAKLLARPKPSLEFVLAEALGK